MAPEDSPVIAKLAITNLSGVLLEQCSVRLISAYKFHNGYLWQYHQCRPSICAERGEGFLLRWSSVEAATPDRKHLDLPADGIEHFADVLVLRVTENGAVGDFAAANAEDLADKLGGISSGEWWKLTIAVTSKNGRSIRADYVACVGDREWPVGPVQIHDWLPRGEQILAYQREQIEEEKRERKLVKLRETTLGQRPTRDTQDSHKLPVPSSNPEE